MVVGREGVYVECYGQHSRPSLIANSNEKNQIFQKKKEEELNRSMVRPFSGLVEGEGFEPSKA